jgi:hypothetical protein
MKPLVHVTHSQIVGTPVFPGQVMKRLEEAIRNYYYVNFGECLMR